MVKLEFKEFLPQEEKPVKVKKFIEIASNVYEQLEGRLVFLWIEALEQFDIKENTTVKNDVELKNMLGDDSAYLV